MHNLFVIGGARSGKSRYAQARAEATGLTPVFIATAQAFDEEMHRRIARHKADRGDTWQTIEAPINLCSAVDTYAKAGNIVLIDCLTLWVTNLLLAGHDIASAAQSLVRSITQAKGPVIIVSNETGWGIVPDNALTRRFRDEAGLVNQMIAAASDEVQLLCAGIPVQIKKS